MLAYLAGPPAVDQALVWVDRRGTPAPSGAPVRPYQTPRLSPDGEQVAFMTPGATMDVWVHDFRRGNATRFISEVSNQFPIWTPDGKRLTYRATRAGTRNIVWRMADGSGTEERLTTGKGNHSPDSWSPDGQVLLFTDSAEGGDILALRRADHKTQPFLRTEFLEGAARFSPDGRWIAYVSEESGRREVYAQPYPSPGGKSQISMDGGAEPVWNPNGRELFYRAGKKMMAVEVATKQSFVADRPELLFTADFVESPWWMANYDVSRDGRRFLMVQPSPQENATPAQITVVLNWFDELKRLVPTPK
jgi:eukaryotic-like serine/threonine-protein kinase